MSILKYPIRLNAEKTKHTESRTQGGYIQYGKQRNLLCDFLHNTSLLIAINTHKRLKTREVYTMVNKQFINMAHYRPGGLGVMLYYGDQ